MGSKGIEQWIETQLYPERISDTQVDQKLAKLSTLSLSSVELIEKYPRGQRQKPNANGMKNAFRVILGDLVAQKFIRATESNRHFNEVLVDFWFNHFNVDGTKGATRYMITSYERDVIRPHLFGSFFDLLKATAQSPAMLFYLDNFQSVKEGGSPRLKNRPNAPKGLNENYARELMELHTLGVDGGYSQKDIIEVARILTGWGFKRKDNGGFAFRKQLHDMGSKTVMGKTFPAGRGIEEGMELLKFLTTHPSTARFISHKLAVRFISDDPPTSAVDALAEVFQKTGGNLREVYRTLFSLKEFWDTSAHRSKIKKPFHFLASSLRSLEGGLDPKVEKGIFALDRALKTMGEPVYRCHPPTGFDETAQFWVNSGALVARIQSAIALCSRRIPGVEVSVNDVIASMDAQNLTQRDEILGYLNKHILFGDVKAETISQIVRELEQEPTVMDQKRVGKRTKLVVATNVSQALGLLLGSPEFQRY